MRPGEVVWIDDDGLPSRAGGPARAGGGLHLRARLLRAARLVARRRRGARGARAHGRAARRGGAGRRRPRDADPRLRHACRDRLREALGRPVRGGADQEPLRRAHVHRARPGAPAAGNPHQVQPARRDRRPAARDRRRLDRAREHDARSSSRCSSRPGRPRCTSASPRRRSSPPASTGSTWPTRTQLAAAHRSVEEMREHDRRRRASTTSRSRGCSGRRGCPAESVLPRVLHADYPTRVPETPPASQKLRFEPVARSRCDAITVPGRPLRRVRTRVAPGRLLRGGIPANGAGYDPLVSAHADA